MRRSTNPNDILCPFCLDILTFPRVLPCLHTYCEKCLGDHIRNSLKNGGDASSFKCPTCEKETLPSSSDVTIDKWAEHFPYDRILMSMLPEGKNKVDFCEQCMKGGKKEPADSFCTNCREALCKTCVGIHISAKQKHSFININNPRCRPEMAIGISVGIKCSRHIHNDLEYYCGSHEKVCCTECFYDHRNCKKTQKLTEYCILLSELIHPEHMAQNIIQLADYLDTRIEMNKGAISKIERETKSMVDEIDNLITLLNETKYHIIKEREELLTTESLSLNKNNRHYYSMKAALLNSLKSYEEVCKYGETHECFVILHKVEDQIMQCENILQTKYPKVRNLNSKLQLASRIDGLKNMDANQLAKVNVTEHIHKAPTVPSIVRIATLKEERGKGRKKLPLKLGAKRGRRSMEITEQVMKYTMNRVDAATESKPESKPDVCALYDLHKEYDTELSFKKGDILQLIDDSDNDWWLVRQTNPKDTKTLIEGYVPRNYVAAKDSKEAEEWYMGKMTRKVAEPLLLAPGQQPGVFLVRETEQEQYILSIRDHDPNNGDCIKHYRIRNMDNGHFYIGARRTFVRLTDLVYHYQANADGLCKVLTNPCPKPKPVMNDLSRETKYAWEIPRDSLEFVVKVGAGRFGEVWKGKWKHTTDIAIKTIKPGMMSPKAFLDEAMIMKQCRHDNIVRLYAVCAQEEPIYIVTELMSKGSLLSYLRDGEGRTISLETMLALAAQIACGMAYLEEHKMIHQNLAARNILVGDNNIAKLADFALAKLVEDEQGAKFSIKWIAPEAALSGKFTIKSDVWSYGILLVEILTKGGLPYPGITNLEVVKLVDRGYRIPKPSDCPDCMYGMMLKCWDKIAENRPQFEFLFDFFNNYSSYAEPVYG